jgi:hypothetical protein
LESHATPIFTPCALILKEEAAQSSKMLVSMYKDTLCHNSEDHNLDICSSSTRVWLWCGGGGGVRRRQELQWYLGHAAPSAVYRRWPNLTLFLK